jgi:murein DD-endopeptidase MepM/ murein hydrolase activator NlpD
MTTAREALSKPLSDPITAGSFRDDELAVIFEDLDLEKIILDLANFKKGKMNVRQSVLSADCELSLDGAHQVQIVIHDPERILYHSGILDHAVDLKIRGWWWRLARRQKSSDDITLTFEPRIVAWMRAEKGRKKVRRGRVTRAEFIRALVKAISRGRVKFIAPELHRPQKKVKVEEDPKPKSRSEDKRRKERAPGFPKDYRIPGEHPGDHFDAVRTKNAERVLIVGAGMGARRKVELMAMMTVFQESRFSTAATNGSHVGLFQQSQASGWPATRVPETDAKAFFKKAIAADKANPNGSFNDVIQAVQGAGPGERVWADWRAQAEDMVDHFIGGVGNWSKTVTVNKPYEFRVKKKENYYGAAMRLADEVNWRLWTVRDTFHYQSEESLFQSKSLMTLKEGKDGIDNLDFDDDDRRPVTEVTVTCRMRMWLAPIGTVVTIADDCTADGRYLVHTISRSYFSQFGSITLRKPTEPKPEPANETRDFTFSGQAGGEASGKVLRARSGYPVTETTSVGPVHETMGLPGFPAKDFMAPAGSPCVAPAAGTVTKLSGSDPSQGPSQGPHGPFGYSVYIYGEDTNKTYFLTHMGSRSVHQGDHVLQGQQIGTVGNYARWGGANHIHMGVHEGKA